MDLLFGHVVYYVLYVNIHPVFVSAVTRVSMRIFFHVSSVKITIKTLTIIFVHNKQSANDRPVVPKPFQ